MTARAEWLRAGAFESEYDVVLTVKARRDRLDVLLGQMAANCQADQTGISWADGPETRQGIDGEMGL